MRYCSTLLILITISLYVTVSAQQKDEFGAGNAFALVYANFHYELSNNDEAGTAFEIRRAYLGYRRKISTNFSAEVKLDIGSPGDASAYSLLRRFAYFRTAALNYSTKNFTWRFGLIDLEQYKTQEKFWGYRYIYKSFQDEQRYGHTADLGTGVSFMPIKNLLFDFSLTNGEGANRTQNDNNFKMAGGITYIPFKGLTTRIYTDILRKDIITSTYSVFAGYNHHDKFRIGAEGAFKENEGFKKNLNRFGYSVYGSYQVSKKTGFFARYDNSLSNTPIPFNSPWNLNDDGSTFLAGIEYLAHEKVKFSLNYQDWFPYANNLNDYEYIFLNLEFSF
jgi:hypothetical protein